MVPVRFLSLFLISSLWTLSGHSVTDYSSKSLSLKDYSEMRQFIQNRIIESKNHLSQEDPTVGVDEVVEHLKESLKLVLMKPDRDHKNPSLIFLLQNEIMNYRSFDIAFREVVETAVEDFKSSKNNPKYQVSLLYVLENSMAHLKSINNAESTKALKKIAGGNLTVSKKMLNYLYLEMGRGRPLSPSSTAKLILKERMTTKQAEELNEKAFKAKQAVQSEKKLTTVKETEAYRASASEKEESYGLIDAIKSWFKKSEPVVEEESSASEDKEDSEVIQIEL